MSTKTETIQKTYPDKLENKILNNHIAKAALALSVLSLAAANVARPAAAASEATSPPEHITYVTPEKDFGSKVQTTLDNIVGNYYKGNRLM